MSEFLSRIGNYSAKRLALLADELNSQVQKLEAGRRAPVAIVGIGCRFPGGADSPDEFWRLLRDGVDAISEVPPDRWNVADYYDPDPNAAGRMSTKWGGFVGPVDGFDAHFFGVSPREALSMDPQQRLLLETAWRGLEHAGIDPDSLEGTRTAVYVGMSAGDYYQKLLGGGLASFDAYAASGIAHSIASGRLSYYLGLKGPSVSIDTACSSSLVALHHAVQSLRRGESDIALAGGVNLILGPEITIALSRSHMMAPDGRCKAFDSRADGFVRGEGCGMLVLKRLSDAMADGDTVVAVIRGSASNQDGRSNGLTAPNGPSQEAVLREALADAGYDARAIGYVEAHGTGTALGDPIEVRALQAVLGAGRSPGTPLLVGSVKANIGHLEAAAGVAGVIKLALALQHGEIPGQLHLHTPNPHIPWDEINVRVPRALQRWPENAGQERIGGVSSFGFSGTNVHVVLSQAPAATLVPRFTPVPEVEDRPLHLLAISARTEPALRSLAADWEKRLKEPGTNFPDVAFSANHGRAHLPHRLALVAASREEALERLAATAAAGGDASTEGIARGVVGNRAPKIAFLFTGQGAQHAGMARALYDRQPQFRDLIDRCCAHVDGMLGRPLRPILFDPPPVDGPSIDDTEYTQPALFTVEYALAMLWMSWGVRPSLVMGHSVGEFVAACIAGVFSLEDGLALICARGRLMGALPRNGTMLAAVATPQEASAAIETEGVAGDVGIAAINGEHNVVISGLATSVRRVQDRLEAGGLRTTPLNVSHAFHSPLMAPMLDEFEKVLRRVRFEPPRIDLVSNVTGEVIGERIADPAYWREHVLAPVRFSDAMATMARRGCDTFVEVGPHPTLLGMARQCIEDEGRLWLPSLRRGREDWSQMLESMAALYVRGVKIDWAAFDAGRGRQRVPVPGYPFQRERYWIDARPRASVAPEPVAVPVHPLLGHELLQCAVAGRLFESRIETDRLPWLQDHRIHGSLLLPSPAFMEAMLAAASRYRDDARIRIEDLVVHQPLEVDAQAGVIVQTLISPTASAAGEDSTEPIAIRIHSRRGTEREWTLHASARLASSPEPVPALDSAGPTIGMDEAVDVAAFYQWLATLGLEFGSSFRAASHIVRRDGEACGRVQLPECLVGESGEYGIHPAVLDGCLHLIGAALPDSQRPMQDPFLLISVERLEFHERPGPEFWARVCVDHEDLARLGERETFRAHLDLLDDRGTVLMRLSGMHLKRASRATIARAALPTRVRAMLHEIAWREVPIGDAGLPSVPALLAQAGPMVRQLSRDNRLDDYAHFLSGLDRLAGSYAAKALVSLGFEFEPGIGFDPGALRIQLGVADRCERLFRRLLVMLAEDGFLASEAGRWRVVARPTAVEPEADYSRLLSAHPQAEAELDLTHRCGQSLALALRSQVDPLDLLFPGGSLASTERLYQSSPPARTYNALIASLVAAMQSGFPSDRPLRILEIGAGTGSTTAFLLPELTRRAGAVTYAFTDVSPLFLARAREKFPDVSFVHYELLDIGKDPVQQGFPAEGFDVVIGANVLHATPDLAVTLGHVRTLMAPGGYLVLLEGAVPQRFGDLTVGLLDGWWCYTDTQRRDYALMSRESWLGLLAEMGFEDAAAVPGDDAGPVLSQQAVYLARSPARQDAEETSSPRWLIVGDGAGMHTQIVQALCAAGIDADAVSTLGEAPFAKAIGSALERPADGVAYLAPESPAVRMTTGALIGSQQRIIEDTLGILRAVQGCPAGSVPRLFLVTRGGQPAGDGRVEPAQATVWGLGHVVAIEHPELRCRRIDLDPDGDVNQAAAAILAEIRDGAGREDQLAWRRNRRMARRLVRSPARAATSVAIDSGRTYLVTGGMRGLGLLVAQWLAEQGARHLVLLGRQAPGAQARAAIERLEAAGAEVRAVQADVSSLPALAEVLKDVAGRMPPLAGVVHAAGVLDDGVLSAQSWERFRTVMEPKVFGSWNLHTLTQGLDFLVLFSSGASLAGSPGQANHAAANAFEDALAWYRQAMGLPTLSINWGVWAEIGAAADRGGVKSDLKPIRPEDGLRALSNAMASRGRDGLFEPAQIGVLDTDWFHLGASGADVPSLLRELAPSVVNPRPGQPRPAATEPAPIPLREQVLGAMPNRRMTVLRDFVLRQTARVLGVREAQALDVNEPFRQMGLDSLMAVELRNLISKALQHPLPATVTFDHPSVAALTEHLWGTVFEPTSVGQIPLPPSAPTSARPQAGTGLTEESLSGMSNRELASVLASRLRNLG